MTMTDFFEVDEKQKTVKILNLDDFSVEDLQNYISELKSEILRVKDEIKKKENLKLMLKSFLNNYLLIFRPLNLFWNLATCPSDSLRPTLPPVQAG